MGERPGGIDRAGTTRGPGLGAGSSAAVKLALKTKWMEVGIE
jgi:hypothetical protein